MCTNCPDSRPFSSTMTYVPKATTELGVVYDAWQAGIINSDEFRLILQVHFKAKFSNVAVK